MVENECILCRMWKEYFSRLYPERIGQAMCTDCMEKAGIVLIDLPYKPSYQKNLSLPENGDGHE